MGTEQGKQETARGRGEWKAREGGREGRRERKAHGTGPPAIHSKLFRKLRQEDYKAKDSLDCTASSRKVWET